MCVCLTMANPHLWTTDLLHNPLSEFLHWMHRSEDKGKNLRLYIMKTGDRAAVPLLQLRPIQVIFTDPIDSQWETSQ